MATETSIESTESVKVDAALLATLRQWADSSGRTLAGQIRMILQPACLAYLEGRKAALMELGEEVKKEAGR